MERGGGLVDQASRLILDEAIVTSRGGVFLRLTVEQHKILEVFV